MSSSRSLFRQPYIQTCFSLVFLFSASVIGCLNVENPSPLEKKLQDMAVGTSAWVSEAVGAKGQTGILAGIKLAQDTSPLSEHTAVEEIVETN